MGAPPPDAQWFLPTEVTVCSDGSWMSAFEFCVTNFVEMHVITAWNPGDDRPGDEVNDEQNEKLRIDIQTLGLDVLEALGSDPNSDHGERSWAVVGMTDKQAIELGRKYRQVAVFRITQARQSVLGCLSDWEVDRGSKLSIGYAKIEEWLTDRRNFARLSSHFEQYFQVRKSNSVWHGQHFEWFAARTERDRFTEVDLAAIGALSVELRGQTARELIEDADGNLAKALAKCESWVAEHSHKAVITEVDETWLLPGSPFNLLYSELVRSERVGLGQVKTSKFMAAKYPGLIPIEDSKVRALLRPMDSELWWKPIRDLVCAVEPMLDQLVVSRDDIQVTTLRKHDVILWMEASERGLGI